MKKLFTFLGALLLWQAMAVAQNHLYVYHGDTCVTKAPIANLDSATVRDRMFYGYTDEDWVSIGYALYTEDMVTTIFNVENITYEVEVQTVPEAPGLYRLVNPYGAAYPYNAPGDYDTHKNHYMVIDAQDPEGVYIKRHYSGMTWSYGEFIFHSMAGYYIENGYSLEAVKAQGYCGTLADGVITFPAGTLLIGMDGGGLYRSNQNGMFKITLPEYANAKKAPARKSESIERKITDKQLVPFALEQKEARQAPAMQRAIPTKKTNNEAPQQLMMCPVDQTIK